MAQLGITARLALLIASMFGLIWTVHSQCAGDCVPLSQCKNNDFGGFFDLRVGLDEEVKSECDHYLQVCCDKENIDREVESIDSSTSNNGKVESGNYIRGSFNECGNRNTEGVAFAIQGAVNHESEYAEFPWMVAVSAEGFDLSGETERKYICGGSLLYPNVVLTAAHCVVNRTADTIYVRAGEWDSQTINELYPHQDRRVSNVVIHEAYNQAFQFNNIALLFLESQFEGADNVQTICLPPQGTVFSNENCIATGWGKDKFNSNNYQTILKKIELPMVSNTACQTALRTTRLGKRFSLHNSFICAGGQADVDTCTGDGGSPLVCPIPDQPNKYYQAGIVAWGIGCGIEGIPGVYTRVSLYSDWIFRTTELQGLAEELTNI